MEILIINKNKTIVNWDSKIIKQKKEDKESIEYITNKIINNKNLKKITIFALAGLMYAEKALAATVDASKKINTAGSTIFEICRNIGYWACLIMCIIEIIRSLMQGDTKGISKIISKYVVGFGALYIVPWIFDLIKGIFS